MQVSSTLKKEDDGDGVQHAGVGQAHTYLTVFELQFQLLNILKCLHILVSIKLSDTPVCPFFFFFYQLVVRGVTRRLMQDLGGLRFPYFVSNLPETKVPELFTFGLKSHGILSFLFSVSWLSGFSL